VVVQRTQSPGAHAPAYLEAEDGTVVPLELHDTLAEPYSCISQVEFLTPNTALEAFTTYAIKFDVSGVPQAQMSDDYYKTSYFKTGGADAQEDAPSEISIEVFHVANDAECAADEENDCEDVIEVTAGSSSLSGSPTWLRLSTSKDSVVGPLGTGALSSDEEGLVPHEEFAHVSLVVSGAECVRYERINARGEVISKGEICEPSKCVSTRARRAELGCGEGYPQLGPEVWNDVSEDSCNAPPRATLNKKTHEWEIEAASCSIRGAGANSATAWSWLGLTPLLLLRGLRRRRTHNRRTRRSL
jgi:hypothetical protein